MKEYEQANVQLQEAVEKEDQKLDELRRKLYKKKSMNKQLKTQAIENEQAIVKLQETVEKLKEELADLRGKQDKQVSPDQNETKEEDYIHWAYLKPLDLDGLVVVKKLFKEIQEWRHSSPFKLALLDRKTDNEYYSIIDEPMNLQTMEHKLDQAKYINLAQFLGDVTKIVRNCRYFYPSCTLIYKTADKLETFVARKLPAIIEKILAK